MPVVRGIQLAQGLSFAMTAVKYFNNVQDIAKSKKSSGDRDWLEDQNENQETIYETGVTASYFDIEDFCDSVPILSHVR